MSDFINLFMASIPALTAGLLLTIKIISLGFIIALIVGLIFGIINVGSNKGLKAIAKIYIDFVRGTPLLVQVFFIYFGLPMVLHFKFSAVLAGVIAIGVNASAYIAEIVRSGIISIEKGQMEAARSLGLPYGASMRKVILPQAFKRIIPPLVNQLIISMKDTSLLSSIGVLELTSSGQIIIASTFKAFQIWIIVGFMYLIVIEILTLLSSRVERLMS